jgi:hypothetical protein
MSQRFDFRNPPFTCRVLLVAGALAMPGALAGAMVSLFVPLPGGPLTGFAAGALAGAVLGTAMEAKDASPTAGVPSYPGGISEAAGGEAPLGVSGGLRPGCGRRGGSWPG